MRACVLRDVRSLAVEDRPKPAAARRHVLVEVEAASICGTDAHMFEGTVSVPFPRVPGHDFSGTVAEVGADVDGLAAGDRVAVKPSFPCGSCAACRAGQYGECHDKRLIGLLAEGCMQEFIAVPDANVVRLPDEMTFACAAVLEPFAVALNTFQRVRLQLDESVVVLGQGPIGLAHTRLAYLSGAGEVIAVDVREEALAFARRFGATVTINPRQEDAVERVRSLTGRGADVVVEAAGVAATVGMQLDLVRKEGRVVNVGIQQGMGAHDLGTVIQKTLTVLGIGGNGGRGQYERVIDLARRGRIDPESMITHRFPVEDAPRAFDLASGKREPVIKVLLTF